MFSFSLKRFPCFWFLILFIYLLYLFFVLKGSCGKTHYQPRSRCLVPNPSRPHARCRARDHGFLLHVSDLIWKRFVFFENNFEICRGMLHLLIVFLRTLLRIFGSVLYLKHNWLKLGSEFFFPWLLVMVQWMIRVWCHNLWVVIVLRKFDEAENLDVGICNCVWWCLELSLI